MVKKTTLESNVEKVLEALRTGGYCESTIFNYQRVYVRLLKAATIMKTDVFNDALANYFVNDSTNVKNGQYCHSRKLLHSSCIRKLREYEEKGYIGWKPCVESKVGKPVTIRFQTIHAEFLEYLKSESKSKNTVDSYRNSSCKFLTFIERLGYTDLNTVPLKLIHEFFCELRGTWDPGSLRTAASGLRSFLNFAEGGTKLLSEVPDKFLRKRGIIPVLTQEEERAVWAVLKTDAVSSRDKAIMVLSPLTGLRAVDIVNLRLSDINWHCDAISITQRKTNEPLALPLLPMIGNAMARYIVNERPKSDSPYVFLSYNAPHKPLKDHASCYFVVKTIFSRAGVRLGNELKGTRLLRHHVASKMLKMGVAVQTISLTLGHVNPNSADIYLTTDEKGLRNCALTLSLIPMKVGELR
ncbi:MAG: tyrosine-type recombinase/integrase [Desulfitobacteriaceae bacterium]